ncbi:WRKY domain - like 10 [Theobroma cacao]|nr:WRKY domain - like 10 [Theobroma cacao]
MGTTLFPCPERLSSDKKRVIQELVHGQECATQLQILFHKPSEERGQLTAKELVQKILRSFNETISVLSSCDSAQVSRNQATNSNDDSPCCVDRRSEDSSESRKRPSSKDRRGCYKRKRAANTWTVISAAMEDGHAWRKYGQKEILNAKHPSKQQHHHHHCLNPSPTTPTVKQESKEETTASDLTDWDSNVWKDIIGLSGFEIMDLQIKPVEFQSDFTFDENTRNPISNSATGAWTAVSDKYRSDVLGLLSETTGDNVLVLSIHSLSYHL